MNDQPTHSDGTGTPAGSLYQALADHQRAEEWEGQQAASNLQLWEERFVAEIKLSLPPTVLRLEDLPVSQLGHFRLRHNGFGMRGEVAINRRYLNETRPRWEPMVTLLHQLLHAEQQWTSGRERPCHVHDLEYRLRGAELGLAIDCRGMTACIPGGPFATLLTRHKIPVQAELIEAPGLPAEPKIKRLRGSSKLRKYSCGCTTIRVAQRELRAMCLRCGNEFREAGAGLGEHTDSTI